jgi:hypothetical protein
MPLHHTCRPEQHYVFEGAQVLLDAGLNTFKFKLQPESAAGVIADVSKKPPSMLEVSSTVLL